MRRLAMLTVATILAALVLGCDDDPVRRATPRSTFEPEGYVCHDVLSLDGSPAAYRPGTCQGRHVAETVKVGMLMGAVVDRPYPPQPGSEAIDNVYASCDEEALPFLGGDWRESRLALSVLVPSNEGWAAGERWYRCDLSEMNALDDWTPSQRVGSLRDSLVGDSPLRLGCFDKPTIEPDRIVRMPPASCTGPHDTEFVGAWRSTTAPDEEDVTEAEMTAGCLELAGRYVGAPPKVVGERMRVRTFSPDAPTWVAGSPGALCFLQAPSSSLTRPLKGAGSRGLPAARG